MSFGGDNLKFTIDILTRDQSQPALASALARFNQFGKLISKPLTISFKVATAGLQALQGINLGLRPLVSGLDALVTRGAAIEVVSKSFASLTGAAGPKLDRLAQSIVRAASGTVTLNRAMQVANRSLASGLNFNQLLTQVAQSEDN